jgi:hypothetical protein
VSHRIDDPAFAFVTPPLKKDKKAGKENKKIKNRPTRRGSRRFFAMFLVATGLYG